jgi:tape measure domain-containing protein
MPESNAKVTGDFSSLINGAENAAKSIAKIGAQLTGIAAASKAFDVATSAISGTVNALGKIGMAAMGIEAIGKSAVGMANTLLKANASLEMTTISFKTLLGSAQAADDMIRQLTKFAANTPFNLPGLELATQRLLGAGYAAKDIVPMMTALGDSIAALGGTQDQLNSLVYVFGQMRNEAHLNAGDIMQMSNLGIPALQMLADHYKVTTAEIQIMISKGLIPGKEAAAIFATEMEKKYGGMMDAQSKTFSGMISNLQDWATATMMILTKPFFEPAKKALKAFLDYVQSPAGVAAINKLAGYIQEGVDRATAAFIKALPAIKAWVGGLEQTFTLIMARFAPGVTGLGNQLNVLWERIKPVVKAVWDFKAAISPLSVVLDTLRGYLTGGFAGAMDALKERFLKIVEYARIGFNFALEEAKKFGPALLTWVINTAVMLADKVVSWGQALIVWVAPYVVRLVNELIRLGVRIGVWVISYAPVLARQLVRWTDVLAGWIIPAIPGIVRSLEQVGAVIVNWGVTRLPVLIGDIVVGIGRGFGVNLRGPVSDLLKVFDSLVSSIRSTVLPAFLEMVNFLSTDLMPIIDRAASFIANTLIPTAADLAAFVMTTLVPAFVRAADLLGLIFGPSLTLIGSIIRNELLPALSDSWTYFDGKYMPTIRDLAAALGDKLAEGIRLATDKFEAAIPKLDDFYKKIEPIVGKAIDLYKAISPISIALDVLKGFLEGGLQGGFGALEQHVVDLGKVFGLDLQPVIDWFNDTVVKNVIPTLKDWAKTFIDDWWPKIRDAVAFVWGKLGDFWTFVSTKIWPPFKSFLDWLGEQWGKVGKSIGETWETTIKPALVHFWEYITNVLWPKLRDDVFPWIEKHVKPILETAFGIIADHIIPDLGKFVDLVLNHVIPALVGWWGVLFTLFNPFIETAGKLIGNLLGNTKDLKDPVSKVMDVFKNMADTFKTDVIPVLDRLASIMHTIWWLSGGWAVELAIGNLGGDWLTQKIDALEKAANPSQTRLEQYMKDHPNYDPAAAGNAPKKASGDSNWRGGLVEVGDGGMELIRTASNQLMLATRPMLLNLERGSQIYSNQQTMNMFKSLPASPQQIHNMYQTSNSSYGNSYSNSSTSNFNLNANMPVDLSNALQRYYRQQQFLYGK